MRGEGWIVGGVLAALAAACGHTAWSMAPTFDEPLHLAAGLTLWELGDHRFSLEHGPVPRLALALPAKLLGARLPPRAGDAWRRAAGMGFPFVKEYVRLAGPELDRHVRAARCVNVAVTLLLALAVWRWARGVAGPLGGIAALASFALCPTLLAHGSLATTDVWAALAFVWAAWRWDRLLERPSRRRLAASAAALGFLFAVKLSAPVFLVVAALIAGLRKLAGARFGWRSLAGWTIVHALAAWLAVWGAYGFRHGMFAPGHGRDATPTDPWETLLPAPGLGRSAIDFVRARKLLPDAFVYGGLYAAKHAPARDAFLCGAYTHTRFAWYFPLAFLLKTPPLAIAALGYGVWLWARGGWRHAPAAGALALAYAAAATLAAPNIGVRHLLPALAAGHVLLAPLTASRVGRGLLALMLGAGLLDAGWNHPHHLAYFTPAVGGWPQGHRYLADSNLDWGQDAARAAAWLHEPHQGSRYAMLFGHARMESYGAQPRPPFVRQLTARGLDPAADYGGAYLVSATTLRSPALSSPAALADDLRWGEQALRRLSSEPNLTDAERAELLWQVRTAAEARLRLLLADRRPDGFVGHGLLRFQLADAELKAALFGPPAR